MARRITANAATQATILLQPPSLFPNRHRAGQTLARCRGDRATGAGRRGRRCICWLMSKTPRRANSWRSRKFFTCTTWISGNDAGLVRPWPVTPNLRRLWLGATPGTFDARRKCDSNPPPAVTRAFRRQRYARHGRCSAGELQLFLSDSRAYPWIEMPDTAGAGDRPCPSWTRVGGLM